MIRASGSPVLQWRTQALQYRTKRKDLRESNAQQRCKCHLWSRDAIDFSMSRSENGRGLHTTGGMPAAFKFESLLEAVQRHPTVTWTPDLGLARYHS